MKDRQENSAGVPGPLGMGQARHGGLLHFKVSQLALFIFCLGSRKPFNLFFPSLSLSL